MMPGTLGNTYIDQILGEYIPVQEMNTPWEELLTDESDQLLFALLVELRARRYQTGAYDIQSVLSTGETYDVDESATYLTDSYNVSEINGSEDWTLVDLDFVTEEIDLRFDADINVVLQKPFGSDDVIQYATADSPVVGIPASTSWIYLGAQNGTGGATVQLEAWGGS